MSVEKFSFQLGNISEKFHTIKMGGWERECKIPRHSIQIVYKFSNVKDYKREWSAII